jgi:hypothetical protein
MKNSAQKKKQNKARDVPDTAKEDTGRLSSYLATLLLVTFAAVSA